MPMSRDMIEYLRENTIDADLRVKLRHLLIMGQVLKEPHITHRPDQRADILITLKE